MRYAVKAMRGDSVVDLRLEAEDDVAAREAALREGYTVLAVHRSAHAWRMPVLQRPFPVGLFTLQLMALLEAGLNLVEAMRALAAKEPDALRRRVLDNVLSVLRTGASFSQAIERLPRHFPRIYVAIVQASERTGDLQRALSRYLEHEGRFDLVRKKIASALLYPAVLAVAGSLVLAFLLFYVVPRFARIYEDGSRSLPLFSSLLMALGGWIERHDWSVLAVFITLCAALAYAASRVSVRARALHMLWRVPHVGERMRIYQLARLYGTLGMLLRSGIPVVTAIAMAGGVLASHLQSQLSRARVLIQQGSSISAAMAAAGLSTPIAEQLLLVGERTGQMGEMMERIAAFHDDDLARWLDRFMRLFEPALMAAIGIAVGLVVVLMYMPVFELAGSLQ
jgi:general secretion pathway protein F